MKFTAVVVLFTLAVSARAAVVPFSYAFGSPYYQPYAVAPVSYTAQSAAVAYAPATVFAGHAAAYVASPAGPAVVAPAQYAVPAVVPVAREASYVAANRGAIHVAPLPGHAFDATSVNYEAAPGTF